MAPWSTSKTASNRSGPAKRDAVMSQATGRLSAIDPTTSRGCAR